MSAADYEQTWEEFWRDIVAPDGTVNLDQVKRELHDFRQIIKDLSRLYMEVTGGRVSKPNTDVGVVLDLAEEHCKRQVAQALRNLAEEWEP
jgi:hypothetical protein